MEETNQQKPEETKGQDDSVSTQEPALLSDGGAGFAARLAGQWWKVHLQRLYGIALFMVAVGACAVLVLAFVPRFTLEPAAQAAAAEAAQEEIDPFDGIEIGARAAYVYDVTEGKSLYSKDPALQLPLASITKIMLVLAISEVLQLDDPVTVSREAVEKGGPSLTWGEVWRARDLIDFTLITSSNTGAEALAEAADAPLRAKYPDAPRGEAAVWRMNALAQELDLTATYFINPSGLDESVTQAGALGSARDIALLFARALEHPELFAGTTRPNASLAPLNFPERTAQNTNNALPDISGILMGKTGTTDLAGGNLAIAFDAAYGRPIVVVVLGATQDGRYEDVKKLVETARKALTEAQPR